MAADPIGEVAPGRTGPERSAAGLRPATGAVVPGPQAPAPEAPGAAALGAAEDGAGAHAADLHGGVEVRTTEDVTAVRFWGAVDLAVRTGGTGDLADLRSGASPMTVDCRDVAFMDSTGLSILVRVVRDAAEDGRVVRFLGASTSVRQLLEATGVDQWMSTLGVRAGA